MEEVRVNVRSRGGSSSKPDFEVLHPPSPLPPRGSVRVYLIAIPHIHPLSSRTFSLPLPPSVSATSRNRQGWLRDEARGDEGGWSRLAEKEEGGGRRGGGLSRSLDQYSHLVPAGPGRTLRSEAHLLADIKPPFLRAVPTPSTPAAGSPFFLPFVPSRPLGRPTLSANPRDLHPPRRTEAFAEERKFFVPPRMRPCGFHDESRCCFRKA